MTFEFGQYLLLIKPITAAIADNPRATNTVNPDSNDARREVSGIVKTRNTCMIIKENPHATGLANPKQLYRLRFCGINSAPDLLVDINNLDASLFKPLSIVKHNQSYRTKHQARLRDSGIDSIPAGTVLHAKQQWSCNSGRYFFESEYGNVRLLDFPTLHPCGLPVFDPDYIEEI